MFYLILLVAQAFLFFRVVFFNLLIFVFLFFFFNMTARCFLYTKDTELHNSEMVCTCKWNMQIIKRPSFPSTSFSSQYWRATFSNGLSDWSVLTNSRYPKVRFSSLRSFHRFRISHHSCRIAKIASLLIMSSSAISRLCLSPSTLFTRP